jgi:3-deoxy-manno-octulosonate cytidylyltransferase (CMP-KDO synthetase)
MVVGLLLEEVSMRVVGLIPSRLNSSRLPSKALLKLDGLPLVVHTLKRAQLANALDEVHVCTDSDKICQAVVENGGKYIMTRADHVNGTERIAEAARDIKADFIVDIQGDEPLIDPAHIDTVVREHSKHPDWDILIPSLPITKPESPHIVKMVHDINFRIVYLSRAVIPQPFRHRPSYYLKHLSIISFKPEALQKFASLPPSNLEIAEGVELLRALENGLTLGTVVFEGDSFSVDVEEDYIKAKEQILKDEIRKRY